MSIPKKCRKVTERMTKIRPIIADVIICWPDLRRSGLLVEVVTIKAPIRIKIKANPPASEMSSLTMDSVIFALVVERQPIDVQIRLVLFPVTHFSHSVFRAPAWRQS